MASNSADYGRNNSSTGNNTDEVATAQLGGSYAAGSGATTIAATSTITNIVEAAKVKSVLMYWAQTLQPSEQRTQPELIQLVELMVKSSRYPKMV